MISILHKSFILAALFLFTGSQYAHAQVNRNARRLTLQDLQLTQTQRQQLQQLVQEEKIQQLVRQKRLQLILTPEQLKKLRQSGKQHQQLFNDSLNHKNEPR